MKPWPWQVTKRYEVCYQYWTLSKRKSWVGAYQALWFHRLFTERTAELWVYFDRNGRQVGCKKVT